MLTLIRRFQIPKTSFLSVLFYALTLPLFAFQQEVNKTQMSSLITETSDCGSFRTQTQGGWGSNAAGNNPGAYRDLHFDEAFPNGLSIGCDYSLTLTTSQAVQDFLPSGSTAISLEENLIDPTSYTNVLAGQMVALQLSITFDETFNDFSPSDVNLGDLIINSGTFEGWTVYELFEEANQFIGACASDYSASELNEALSSINENFVDGTSDQGYLDCPESDNPQVYCDLSLTDVTAYCTNDSVYNVEISISGSNATFLVSDENALEGSGEYICLGDSDDSTAITEHTFTLTYSNATNYSAQISALIPAIDGCAEALNTDECILNSIEGPAPICCDFTVSCPQVNQLVFSCISDIPDADTSLISYANNCGPVTIGVSESIQGQGCVQSPYYVTRIYMISDGSTTFTCTENYVAIDSSPPVISCPADENASCDAEITPQNWATATDNCDDDPVISYVNLNGESCDSFIRVWTATDACGNSASCNQTVYVSDTTPPSLIIPGETTIDCFSSVIPEITGEATATDICSEVLVSFSDGEWNGDACSSFFFRTWTATDACGNSVSGEQKIIREDNVGPLLFGIPNGGYLQCGDFPEAPAVTAYDVCQDDSVEVSMTETYYGEGCNRALFRTWTAIDSCGNTSSATRAIYINDTQAPVITCPDSVQLYCGDEIPDTSSAGVATAFDNCSEDDVTITFFDGPLNNDCPPSIHRTWSATDTCGNTSSCIQVISFNDTIPPNVECVNDVTINCSMGDISPLFTGTPVIIDDCSDVELTYSDGEYSDACPVTFTRTWIASDACGNKTICEQLITVIDEVGPVIYCPSDASVECGSSTLPQYTGMAAAYDNCLSVSLTYEDGELSGSCPQSFTRTWTAVDYCGNSSMCTQEITIVDNTAPIITCPETITLSCSSDDLSDSVTGTPEVSDACSSVSLSFLDTQIEGDCDKFFYRLWFAIDECGNASQCYQLINLVDDVAPVLDCPADVVINCDDITEPENTGMASAMDDCSDAAISYVDSLINTGGSISNGSCGQFRTQTQGGWGTRASGGNPGTYRDANFDAAFPEGLVIGCNLTLRLTSSMAVEELLPTGGTPGQLQINMLDPISYNNTLAGQLIALSLSVGFDNYDPDFSEATSSLSDMIIGSGMFAGWTIEEVLEEANKFFGQCESDFTASELNDILSKINENFVDGMIDSGYLICEESETDCFTIYRKWIAVDACGNESSCVQVITASSETTPEFDSVNTLYAFPTPTQGEVTITSEFPMESGDLLELFDLSGTRLLQISVADHEQQQIDLSDFESGVYLLKWSGNMGSSSIQLIKQ